MRKPFKIAAGIVGLFFAIGLIASALSAATTRHHLRPMLHL